MACNDIIYIVSKYQTTSAIETLFHLNSRHIGSLRSISPQEPRDSSDTIPPEGSGICGGSTNGCWEDLSIETDYEATWPNTSKTVSYKFSLGNTTGSPDGIEQPCILVNGQYPGPVIEANWGDWVKVNVNNQLQDNGTSIHWHGIRQKGTNDQDGANGLTEYLLALGQSRTYLWQAISYGTSWHHSHFSSQYTDRVTGPMVIHGPTSTDYDIDLGPVTISEIYRTGGAAATDSLIAHGGPNTSIANNILFNGKNVNSEGGGERLQLTFEPWKHLIRFLNVGSANFYKVGIDDHMLQVVAIDFVPVQPYMATYVSLAIVSDTVRQRVDAIVEASQDSGNYWLRAIPGPFLPNNNDGKDDQNAIISYSGIDKYLPTSKAAANDNDCLDEPVKKTIPCVAKPVDVSKFDIRNLPISSPFQVTTNTEGQVFRWSIGSTTQVVDFQSPILQRLIYENGTITPEDNIIGVDEANTSALWLIWYIQNNFEEPHLLVAPHLNKSTCS